MTDRAADADRPGAFTDADLLAAVRAAPDGVTPRALRRALDLDPRVTPTRLSRLLSGAVDRAIVVRTGRGRSTTYHEAPASPQEPRPRSSSPGPPRRIRVLHARDRGDRWVFGSPDVRGMAGTAATYAQSRSCAEFLVGTRFAGHAVPRGEVPVEPVVTHFVEEVAASGPGEDAEDR